MNILQIKFLQIVNPSFSAILLYFRAQNEINIYSSRMAKKQKEEERKKERKKERKGEKEREKERAE